MESASASSVMLAARSRRRKTIFVRTSSRERAQLLRVLDDEDVFGVVVDEIRMVDRSRNIREIPTIRKRR